MSAPTSSASSTSYRAGGAAQPRGTSGSPTRQRPRVSSRRRNSGGSNGGRPRSGRASMAMARAGDVDYPDKVFSTQVDEGEISGLSRGDLRALDNDYDPEAGRVAEDEVGSSSRAASVEEITRMPGVCEEVLQELKETALTETEQNEFRNLVLRGDYEGDGYGNNDDGTSISNLNHSTIRSGGLGVGKDSPSLNPQYKNEDFVEAITHPGKLCLEWRNLTFTVGGSKTILKNCYGKLYPGQVCALIGPSGAGKSTLMNLLAGRQAWTGNGVNMDGEVRYGGKKVTFDDLKSSIAYVMQQDALLGTQTVRETLTFAARMKLPAGTDKQTLDANVEKTLKQLDLWEQRDVPIGDALRKGISGGQKKRVSAALELLTRPSVMFLDEPTSGLDSFSSLKLIAELKNIAMQEDAIICCTIHQPSSEIFDNFDRVICMRDGEIMFNGYNGKAADLLVRDEQEQNTITPALTALGGGGGATLGGLLGGAFGQLAGASLNAPSNSIYTVIGFLEMIVRQPLPAGYNTADWLLYQAQSMPEEEAREVIEQCARAYELRNHGYSRERVPLIEYREVALNDLPIQNVMSLDKKVIFWGQHGPAGGVVKPALDDLFTVHEDKGIVYANDGTTQHIEKTMSDGSHWTASNLNSAGGGHRQLEQSSSFPTSATPAPAAIAGGMLPAASAGSLEFAENANSPAEAMSPTLQPTLTAVYDEIHDNAGIGIFPDALKRKHLDAKWIQKHPATQQLMLARQKQNGLCFQLYYLTHREWVHRIRDPWILFFRFLIPTLQVALFAAGFANVGRQVRNGEYDTKGNEITKEGQYGEKIREMYGAANNIIWILLFSTATGFTLTIPSERAIFLREYHSNLYGVFPYIVAKILIEMLIIFVQTAWLQGIVHLSWGMNANFLYLWGVTFLLGIGGSGIGLFLAAINCNAPERSVMMTPIFLSSVPNVFSGAFRPVAEMPAWMSWMAYAIPSTYGLRLIGYIENSGQIETTLKEKDQARWDLFEKDRAVWWQRHNIHDHLIWPYLAGLVAIVFTMMALSIAFLKCGSRTLYM